MSKRVKTTAAKEAKRIVERGKETKYVDTELDFGNAYISGYDSWIMHAIPLNVVAQNNSASGREGLEIHQKDLVIDGYLYCDGTSGANLAPTVTVRIVVFQDRMPLVADPGVMPAGTDIISAVTDAQVGETCGMPKWDARPRFNILADQYIRMHCPATHTGTVWQSAGCGTPFKITIPKSDKNRRVKYTGADGDLGEFRYGMIGAMVMRVSPVPSDSTHTNPPTRVTGVARYTFKDV